MKKKSTLSVFCILLILFSPFQNFSQSLADNQINQIQYQYDCEDDLIEVLFIPESKVRLRNGQLTDLATDALSGLENSLSDLEWMVWNRICDVPESEMDEWAVNGEKNTGQQVYNMNNIYRLQIPKGKDIWELCKKLTKLDGVMSAIPVPEPMPLPTPPNYQSQQGYLNTASSTPTGIDAAYAWTQAGGAGTGVTICDLEYSWNYSHTDISKAAGSSLNSWTDPGWGNNHGTAVIGELVSDNNGWGTTGICYGANLKTCGTYYGSPSPYWNVAGAIGLAVSSLSAGDIILLEQQWDYTGSGGYVPIEWWGSTNVPQMNNAVYIAIVNAISNGIHVVEAGGNGNVNTGSLSWYGNSGAIIVGAGGALVGNDLQRLGFSSYGPRFDLQGWGENVVTTGYGDLYSIEGANNYYTSTFSGTSSASPIVTGALACAEGYYLANVSAIPPSPSYMRSHLSSYGTAQIFGTSGIIGPRPDLYATIINFPPPQQNYDWGDAPDFPYPTLSTNNGANHLINPAVFLGNFIDAEANGQPNSLANGDDINGFPDDEDGVTFDNILRPGSVGKITVVASVQGYLNAWIDFNGINIWSDAGEQIVMNQVILPGPNTLTFAVPFTAIIGNTYARFRFASQPGLLFFGPAQWGG
ncbi:MAG: S8 family serine peptidase [Bacteroidales bacterium]